MPRREPPKKKLSYPLVGSHMSIAGGAWKAFGRGVEEGCTVLQIFTKNASRWAASSLTTADALRFKKSWESSGIGTVCAHDSYLINLASPRASLRARSRQAFLEELKRAEMLGIPYLVTHPGAFTESDAPTGLRRIAESLDWIHERSAGMGVTVCLENTAGQGTVLGGDFAHLGEIYSQVKDSARIGICFDTCHAFAAGHDLRTGEGWEAAMEGLEGAVGKGQVKVVHVNDAKGDCGGHLDRHAHLGRGGLGLECFRLVMNDGRLADVPKILETPKEEDGLPMDKVNLAVLRALEGETSVPAGLLEEVERRVREEGEGPGPSR